MKTNILCKDHSVVITHLTSEGGWEISELEDGSGMYQLEEFREGCKPELIDTGYIHSLLIVASELT